MPAPGPGPKYKLLKRRAEGFSFGLAAKYHGNGEPEIVSPLQLHVIDNCFRTWQPSRWDLVRSISYPVPYEALIFQSNGKPSREKLAIRPDLTTSSLPWTRLRILCTCNVSYFVPRVREFTERRILFYRGSRTPGIRCVPTPGSYSASNLNVVKPRAPKYTMGLMQMTRYTTDSPGPKYVVKPPKPTPVYSFGIKHHKCAPPYITECDDKCWQRERKRSRARYYYSLLACFIGAHILLFISND